MSSLFYPVLATVIYAVYKGYKLIQVPKEIKHVPGIPFFSLLKSKLEGKSLDKQYEEIYKPAFKKIGYARMWSNGSWEIVVTDPTQGREILSKADNFLKSPESGTRFDPRMLVSKFFGDKSIVSTDGNEWRRHRKIANPAFKKTWSTEMFGECTLELIERIEEENQQPIFVHQLFQKLTLDALGRGMFSYDFQAVKKGDDSQYLTTYNEIISAAFSPVYLFLPFLEEWVPSRKYYHNKNSEFREFLLNIIKERQGEVKKGVERNDLLSMMIKASMEEMKGTSRLTDNEVLNDLVTFFIAGHDTTASTLTSTFYYLAKHPEIQEKARQEVLKVLGNKSVLSTPSHDQLKEMSYLNCIIKESMRIISIVTQLRRYCKEDTTLSGGLTIQGNSFVNVDLWTIHHNPNLFPEPHNFNPDRFLELHGPQDQAWMAFGSGSRMCVGLNFSLIEQKIVMANLLQKFTFELGPITSKSDKPVISSSGVTHIADMDLYFKPRI